MELNGFMIGPEMKKLFKIKVVTPTARHPVDEKDVFEFLKHLGAWKYSVIPVIVSTVPPGYDATFKVYWTFSRVSTELCKLDVVLTTTPMSSPTLKAALKRPNFAESD